jgi:hypothetical protein
MSRLNDPDNFRGRVTYAAKVIASGKTPTRAFDNCFESYDGDEVSVALIRRAQRNPKIARNLDRYINRVLAEACAARMAHIPTRKLAAAAAATRASRKSPQTQAGEERS